MAITVVQTKVITGANSGSLNSATTAGNTLVVAYAGSNGAGSTGTCSTSGITIGGTALTKQVEVDAPANASAGCAAIYMLGNLAGGQTAIAVTGTGLVAADGYIVAWEVSGLGSAPVLDKSGSREDHSGTTTWSSDTGTAPTTTVAAEFWAGIHAAGPNSGQPDTMTPAGSWTNQAQFNWGSPGGASIAASQVTTSTGSLRYNGVSADFDFYLTAVAAFKPAGGTTHSGTAALSGSGTLTATGAFAGAAALTGSGTLTWSGSRIFKATVLSGSGTLTGSRIGTIGGAAALSGSGTLTSAGTASRPRAAALSGTGSLSVSGLTLGLSLTLAGTGTLTIIGTGGTVQASAGITAPYAQPGTSQVAVASPGSSTWQYLGTLGLVTSLTYSFVCPGGADKLDATVMLPAAYRTQLLNPGWQVRVTRGGHIVWTGRMDEPVPSPSGWQVTAVGDGQRGQDFRAVYTSTWPAGEPDEAVNNAIARGLPWVNPGIGSPSGMWLGQAQDSGSSSIADLLNLVCTRGGLTWYANSQPGGQPGTDLTVFPLPTAVNRLLVVTEPVPRTLGGDINTIFIRYQVTDASSDASGGSQQATYGTTSVQNAASVAAHGVTETNIDLSSAGVMSQSAAQAVGNSVLANYQRASFAGPFTAARGQLLNAGGAPVDPGTDQAGTVVRLILTDYAYGGEVTPAAISFVVGAYAWDDFAGKATITPYQALDQSLSGLLSMESTVLTPITTQQ